MKELITDIAGAAVGVGIKHKADLREYSAAAPIIP